MRKKVFTILLLLVLTGMSYHSFAQKTITGVVSFDTDETIPGVTVLVKDTNLGTISDLDGKYSIEVPDGSEYLIFSYIGMQSQEVKITGTTVNVKMVSENEDIAEVLIVASFAQDRKTPVSFSTITPEVITEKLGNQEFPEILKSTPSVYATKQGGGYGDSRINMRGFDSNNIGVLINGVPVNDMESGKVYWSNWAGLSDVTRLMQVQRGLGASKLAISSVGGTINIITKTTDAKKGGSASIATGNNGYSKTSFTLSTGLQENGWAATVSGSMTQGDGYIKGTDFKGYSYFFNVSKRINKDHSLALSAFGAPQWHNQRYNQQYVSTYLNHPDGLKYNVNYGYRNGDIYGAAYNKYHKPQVSLNHHWNISSISSLSTALYASKSTGGGRRIAGNQASTLQFDSSTGEPNAETLLTTDGYLDFNAVMDINKASDTGSEAIIAMSNNSHDWYGVLSTLNTIVSDINLTVGFDGRYYKGYHYQEVDDLLGGEYYLNSSDKNRASSTPLYKGDKFSYYNLGEVFWEGLFVQGEYVMGNFSAFISGAVSYTTYKRTDYFNYYDDDITQEIYDVNHIKSDGKDSLYLQHWDNLVSNQEVNLGVDELNEEQERELYLSNKDSLGIDHIYQVSDNVNFLAYSAKGGANYNINKNHNVFINGGYFIRAPYLRYAFMGYTNGINADAKPERVLSAEIGYGFRTNKTTVNVNLYRTEWNDKALTRTIGTEVANLTGLNALHQGVEFEATYKPTKKIKINGMFSSGDWRWANDVNAALYDVDQNFVDSLYIYADQIHVSNAAQMTAALGIDIEVLSNLKIGLDYNYYNNLYAQFDIEDRTKPDLIGVDAWKTPDYHLIDFGASYKFKLGNLNASLYGKVNNILDTEYIADATDGTQYNDIKKEIIYGSEMNSPVYFGFGRTWSIALKIRF